MLRTYIEITQMCSHCGKVKPVNMFNYGYDHGIKYVANPRNNKIICLFNEYKCEDTPNTIHLRENCKECVTWQCPMFSVILY